VNKSDNKQVTTFYSTNKTHFWCKPHLIIQNIAEGCENILSMTLLMLYYYGDDVVKILPARVQYDENYYGKMCQLFSK
jgi:hypothetical protein